MFLSALKHKRCGGVGGFLEIFEVNQKNSPGRNPTGGFLEIFGMNKKKERIAFF